VVASLIRRPRQTVVRAAAVVIDARAAAKAVRSGLDQLAKARRVVSSASGVLRGAPVFKGTRIPVHDIASMLANGDKPAAIVKAYPQLDEERIRLAAIYASAYPRRGRPRAEAGEQSRTPKISGKVGRIEQIDERAGRLPKAPIWERLATIGAAVPAEAWKNIPSDFAANVDQYLYGKSKDSR
jgi:uncharacterized protein (DUF433 family)